MRSLRAWVAGAAVLAAATGTAEAQVNYTTTGRFTSGTAGCNQLAAANSVTCAFGAFTLTYTGTTGTNIGNGSVASLGTFLLTGTGSATIPPPNITFEVFISQTTPTVGSTSYSGAVIGSVTTGAGGNVSTLMWDPQQLRSIGPVNYTLVYDNIGPAADRGLGIPINNSRGINVIVNSTSSVVPEPSTYLLMGTGLVALVVTARRRKLS